MGDNNKRLTIEGMKRFATARDGECLSQSYINNNTKLMWKCEKGHIWEASYKSFRKGSWCPECHKLKPRNSTEKREKYLNEIKEIAKSKGGKCLSNNYINSETKLKFICALGHEWDATPANIKRNGTWCPQCSDLKTGERCRTPIEVIKQEAEKKGGKCLSDDNPDSNSMLLFECANGHRWETTAKQIMAGHWCHYCSTGTSEEICRLYFEKIFNQQFLRKKPIWLRNSRGNLMELDGYNEDLKIAFEYNGIQHYEKGSLFINSSKKLNQRIIDDETKIALCKENGILLIVIDYMNSLESIPQQILNNLRKSGYSYKEYNFQISLDQLDAYRKKDLDELQQIAAKHNGYCLSDKYFGNRIKLKWRCEYGHVWESEPINIRAGKWCPVCAGVAKKSITDFQELAKKRNGKCLSKTYNNIRDKLEFECEHGHRWEAVAYNVQNSNSWCPICAGTQRKSINDFRKIAKSKKGKCLSTEYENSNSKLEFECEKGHRWITNSKNVLNGRWCPYCAGNIKATLDDMHELASQYGGSCLSKEYINNSTKLKWKCSKGHIFYRSPKLIKKGFWCDICRKNEK